MKICTKFGFFLLSFFVLENLCEAALYQDKNQQDVLVNPMVSGWFEEVRKGYLESFGEAYKAIPLEVLEVDDKEQFLCRSYQEDVDDYGKCGVYELTLNDAKGELMGYFSFNHIDERLQDLSLDPQQLKEVEGFPPLSAYIRHLYVKPAFQKKGLASLMIKKILPDIFPAVKNMYLATRRVNEPAVKTYQRLGFEECHKSLHGLCTRKYISLEYHPVTENKLAQSAEN